MFLQLACVFAVAAYAGAIVCPPNYCASVDCMQLTADNCNGVIKPNGGFCGCCDACLNELAEGDKCFSTIFLGVPPTSVCAGGLYCDPTTHTCKSTQAKRETGPCAIKLAEVNHRLEASNHMLLGLEKPHCDADGNYAGMQFAGSQAYCVTKDGTAISGYMVNRWETGNDMNCQCARDQYAYMQTGLIGKLFHCAPNGNYATTQCMGDVCFCVDKDGNQVGTATAHIGQLGALNC